MDCLPFWALTATFTDNAHLSELSPPTHWTVLSIQELTNIINLPLEIQKDRLYLMRFSEKLIKTFILIFCILIEPIQFSLT